MRTVALSAAGLATALVAALLVPVSAASAAPQDDIRINEIVTTGSVPDFIEITNIGEDAVDVSGWILKDDNDARTFAIPVETVVQPGGFFAIAVDVTGGFGLSSGDSARLFLQDGTTLVDSYSWTSHGAPSWARCPDGTGDFGAPLSVTFGAANDCPAPEDDIRINEVVSTGGLPDFIEITNIGDSAVDVSGWILMDQDVRALPYPEGTVLEPGEFLAVYVNELPDETPVANGFGLSSGDSARLFLADGMTLVDSYSWTSHGAPSWARCPDGTGDFGAPLTVTFGAANDCAAPVESGIRLNEIESNGGTPGDWVEITNVSDAAIDISNWLIKDNNDSRTTRLPEGSIVAPGAFFIVEEITLGFGLGEPDSVRLYDEDGVTLVDAYSWTTHAAVTYERCPDGTGVWQQSSGSTKGAANDCGSPVRINEVFSQGADFIELVNAGVAPVDISGYVVRDNNDGNTAVIPSSTTLAPGGYYVVEAPLMSFMLGSNDEARLFAADGTTLLDEYAWTEHAGEGLSWSRCPDATGDFARSQAITKGAENLCEGDIAAEPWPGSSTVTPLGGLGTFGGDMSGLAWDSGALWAVNNGSGDLFRFIQSGGEWMRDPSWADGRTLRYPDGGGTVDAEGVGVTAGGASAGIYVASERNNDASSVSRPSVLRYVPTGAGDLTATHEWNLASSLPVVGANAGLEGIAWISDTDLVAQGFVDESTNELYDPRDYGPHAGGVFFVAVEGTAGIYGFVLDHATGDADLVATFTTPLSLVADLAWDAGTKTLWAVCDQVCEGRVALTSIAQSGDADGSFTTSRVIERPAGMANIANEGIALAGPETCAEGSKNVYWSDDAETDGIAIRSGAVDCVLPTGPVDEALLTGATRGGVDSPSSAQPGSIISVLVGTGSAGATVNVWLQSTPQSLGTATVDSNGFVRVLMPADATGQHRIVVTDVEGQLLGWDAISFAGVSGGGALAATGADDPLPMVNLALLLLLVGLAVMVAARREQELGAAR